jgi:DNA repair exonuclease SbcCD ATPase subunit
MSSQITIERIAVAGFRAYLAEQVFHLNQAGNPKSLAILAPNAKGKSGFVDALEFYFSSDGTLARFGERASGTHAGREPLVHSRALKDGSASYATVTFRGSPAGFPEKRVVGKGASPRPRLAEYILGVTPVTFIIRGHDLRAFVENRTPEERYSEVAEWFRLSPLVALQKNLRRLRRSVMKRLDDDGSAAERETDVANITSRVVMLWDDAKLLGWVHTTLLDPLDTSLRFATLAKEDAAYATLTARKTEEDQRAGLQVLTSASAAVRSLLGLKPPPGASEIPGEFATLDEALTALDTARDAVNRERTQAQRAVFREIWEAAEKFLESTEPLDSCPVCGTPLVASPHGTRDGVAVHVHAELEGLAAYRRAQEASREAEATCTQTAQRLCTALALAETALRTVRYGPETALVSTYRETITRWKVGAPLPESTHLRASLSAALTRLEKGEAEIRSSQGDHTYTATLTKLDQLFALRLRLDQLELRHAELQRMNDQLTRLHKFVDIEVRTHVQALLDRLRNTTNHLCNRIQGHHGTVPQIRLELAAEEDLNQQVLHLAFDFDNTRKGVLPQAYLSDSQIHTLALSLRLAAVTLLNRAFPVVVLDDIVTSYDADHRNAIAALVSEDLDGVQTILVTHDQRFFAYLQDRVSPARWEFKRITDLDLVYGPRFQDHQVTDEMIRSKWERGDFAANEIRQAEEEWLLRKCREFGVDIRIRDLNKTYEYDRAELAQALQAFLKRSGVKPPEVPGVKNPFLASLQKGEVENFGSHFQDAPELGSAGDESVRWRDFQEFCSYFECSCGSRKFKRPRGMDRAVCDKCEVPFAFKPLKPAAGAEKTP